MDALKYVGGRVGKKGETREESRYSKVATTPDEKGRVGRVKRRQRFGEEEGRRAP